MLPDLAAELSTEEVCTPMSRATARHWFQRSMSWSWLASSRRSAPVAAISAMAIAIEVSSVHSPGANGPRPPPIMATGVSGGIGAPNS